MYKKPKANTRFDRQAGTDQQKTMSPIALAARAYYDHKIIPIPLVPRNKNPQLTGWPNYRPNPERWSQDFPAEANLGVLLGKPSGDLVDVDCDWPETGILAKEFLPPSWTFGRPDDGNDLMVRHLLLRSVGAKTQSFDAPASAVNDKNRRIIEIFADGRQVMMPPSIHPNGQRVQWIVAPGEIDLCQVFPEDLKRQVSQLAGAALLVRHWPHLKGSQHQVTAALAGACCYAQWPHENIERLLTAVFRLAGDLEERDRIRMVRDTIRKVSEGRPVTGVPKLAELIGPELTACLTEWWRLGSKPPVLLTRNGVPLNQIAPESATSQEPNGSTMASWWPELMPFDTDLQANQPADEPYPVDALGPVLGPAVEALTRRQQVPIALAAQSCLAAAVSVVQMYFDVEVEERIVPPSLFMVLVAVPGERKTTTDTEAMRTVDAWTRRMLNNYDAQIADWNAKKTAKPSDTDPGPRPRRPTLILNNGTTEGIRKSLFDHWPALLLINSDAAAWLGGYSMREGRDSATAATLSNLWSGASDHSVKASQESPQTLTNRRLSMSLMLQPQIAPALLGNQALKGQGFLSRCLVAFPTSTIGTRFYRKRVPEPAWEKFNATLQTLLDRPPPVDLVSGELQPTALPLDEAALEAWIGIYNRLEGALVKGYEDIAEVANKAADQVLRLAGIQAVLEGCQHIHRDQIERADRLHEWYLRQWLTLGGQLRAYEPDVAEPRRLLVWLQQRRAKADQERVRKGITDKGQMGQLHFTLREVYSRGPRFVRGNLILTRELVSALIRRGYVRTMAKGFELRPESI
ncbi:MAG: DUF3987 domain-containing protein [Chromatiaceae bacterium]|nr:DUF3987 domain-containing protein [Chromatiaceae bacterium]